VGHDIWTPVAYSYAVAHPAEVRRLVVMESVIPAFIPTARQGVWWFSFHQTPDVPEATLINLLQFFV